MKQNIFSLIFDKIERNDIGRQSFSSVGLETFGIGLIQPIFYWSENFGLKNFFYQVVDNVSQKRNIVFSNRLNGQG